MQPAITAMLVEDRLTELRREAALDRLARAARRDRPRRWTWLDDLRFRRAAQDRPALAPPAATTARRARAGRP